MFRQIRTLMSEDISLEGKQWKCDEMYIGGKPKNKHRRKHGWITWPRWTRFPVFGMVERGGSVIAKVVLRTPQTRRCSHHPKYASCMLSTVYTDDYRAYDTPRQ